MNELDHHGGPRLRGISEVPRSSIASGRFGRLFRTLEPLHLTDEQLRTVADRMTESSAGGGGGGWSGTPTAQDNPANPAGYTYLAQFLDHDITLDATSSLQRQNDPDALENYRTPRLDLDSIYGGGPQASPYLYDNDDPDLMLIGQNPTDRGFEAVDLPRNQQGRALIGDPRNDVHLIISQLHLAFLRFHNAAVAHVLADPTLLIGAETTFQAAQRLVRWHYQWIVVTDLLPRLVGQETANAVLAHDPKSGRLRAELVLYRPRNQAFMPIEYSAAAYRLGHSMIRPSYQLNATVGPIPIFSPSPTAQPLEDLRGFRPLPANWSVAWERFFPGIGADPTTVQSSRLIDSHIADPLATLPPKIDDQQRSLALLNLFRGDRLGLPAGDAVAAAVADRVPKITTAPLSTDELGLGHPAPLWFYILKEAELRSGGQHLGPVGGRVVAEVIAGLLSKDPASFLRAAPSWTPTFPSAQTGKFTATDLLRMAAGTTA